MDKITRRLIEQYQDGGLKGKPLNLLDLSRLGFPENEVDRADFLDYLERAIKRRRLTQCDEAWIQKEKLRPGMSLTEIADAHVPVPVISPDEFHRFLEHSEPYEPPLNQRLAHWCALSAAPPPAPTLPSPAPAAPAVDPQARSEGDSGDAHAEPDDDPLDFRPRDERRLSVLLKQAAAMGIDLLNLKRGDRERLFDELDSKHPGRFGRDVFNPVWKLGISKGVIKSLKGE